MSDSSSEDLGGSGSSEPLELTQVPDRTVQDSVRKVKTQTANLQPKSKTLASTSASSSSSRGNIPDMMQADLGIKNHSRNVSWTSGDFSSSQMRHPNFHKHDHRIKKVGSTLSMASKILSNTRYFVTPIKSDTKEAFKEYDDPYYYYTVSVNNSSSSSDNNSINDSELGIVLDDLVLKAEELKNFDDQFPPDFKPFKSKWSYFNPVNYIVHFYYGQIFAAVGLLMVFIFGSIGYIIFVVKTTYSPMPPEVYEVLSPYIYPPLLAIRTSLVDPDTPKEFHKRKSFESGQDWELVFSDEFNADGRTFFEGDDQFFQAVDIHYAATEDLEYYIPEMAETRNGSLRLTLDAFPTNGLDYRSAMIQSWNKLCFSSAAIVEVSIKMPGFSQENGLWPAVWSLGNLARPGYQASTDGVWPYTYDECDYGITPNQSSPDGISFLPGQRLSKCTCAGEDHPSIGRGRGAPEIDIIEGFHNPHDTTGLGIQTLQVAPFDEWWRPDYDYMYIENKNITSMKPDTGTPTQEAVAAGTVLNNSWFDSVRNDSDHKHHLNQTTHFQKFGFEYNSDKTPDKDSYIDFFAADSRTFGVRGDALHPNNNIGWRQISKEPMSIVFNLGLSPTWSDIDFGSLEFPAVFEIDYIRIYQPENFTYMTCDPHHYPTTQYIYKHANAYQNFNLTSWEQAGYLKPKNKLMHGCHF